MQGQEKQGAATKDTAAAAEPPDDLRTDVEQRIPKLDLPEAEEGQRHRRIEMRARALPPGREHERGGRQPHREAHAGAEQEGRPDRAHDG